MHKIVIALTLVLGLAACDETRVKTNVECKTYVDQATCETDPRCLWHQKDDGTLRCKGKHEGAAPPT